MFDIGFWEFAALAVIALFVFGPDRLPKVAAEGAEVAARDPARSPQARSQSDRDARARGGRGSPVDPKRRRAAGAAGRPRARAVRRGRPATCARPATRRPAAGPRPAPGDRPRRDLARGRDRQAEPGQAPLPAGPRAVATRGQRLRGRAPDRTAPAAARRRRPRGAGCRAGPAPSSGHLGADRAGQRVGHRAARRRCRTRRSARRSAGRASRTCSRRRRRSAGGSAGRSSRPARRPRRPPAAGW